MLILKYPPKALQRTELEDRLRQLSLAFRSEEDPKLEEPVLIEGRISYTGTANIMAHLDELARELYFWQYCNCAPVDA